MNFQKTLLIIILITTSVSSYSQDTIIKKDQEEILAKVTEVTSNSIKYNFWDRQDGPIYNISKADVFMIIYQDGTKEYYSENSLPKPVPLSISQPKTTAQNQSKTITVTEQLYTQATETKQTTSLSSNNEDTFYHRDGAKFNFGFGYNAGSAATSTTIGIFAPYIFDYQAEGSIDLEVGGTFIFSNGNLLGAGSFNTSIYALSLAFGYGYYITPDFRISAGVGYYYGFGTTTFSNNNNEIDANIDGIYYHTTAEYWLTNGFGFNARYDAIMGTSLGLLILF